MRIIWTLEQSWLMVDMHVDITPSYMHVMIQLTDSQLRAHTVLVSIQLTAKKKIHPQNVSVVGDTDEQRAAR